MIEIDRVPTGVPGFDELCGGGLVRNRTYLLSGTSGTGKTNFAFQFLHSGATQYDEPGVFIATEERPSYLRENLSRFGWDMQSLEDEGKLAIIDACSTKIGIPSQERYVDVRPFDMRALLEQVITIQDEIGAKRAVIDSSTSIGFNLQDPARIRIELLKLSTTLEILGLTSLMTCEIVDDDLYSRFGVENFVTDGTILLYNKREDNTRVRSMEIFKMRGSDHKKGIYPYEITSEGVVIYPREEVY